MEWYNFSLQLHLVLPLGKLKFHKNVGITKIFNFTVDGNVSANIEVDKRINLNGSIIYKNVS